jgi:hypothetical protein
MARDDDPGLDRTLRTLFDVLPILSIPILLYALLAGLAGSTRGADVFVQELEAGRWFVSLPSGAPWAISGGDLLTILGLVFLFFELVRGVGLSRYAIIHHTLAVLMTLGCIGAFLAVDAFATSTFLLLTIMCALDMLGGILMNIANAGPGPDED